MTKIYEFRQSGLPHIVKGEAWLKNENKMEKGE